VNASSKVAVLLTTLFLGGCERQSSLSVAPPPPKAGAQMFEEIAESVGLSFMHDSGAKGEYFMPEQAGSGVAFIDYDNDGLLDLYLVQCGGADSAARNQLFRQEVGGRFRDASEDSGLDVTGHGMGAIVGDLDNDGWADLVLTEYGRARVFLNRRGKFEEVSARSGVDNPRWGTAASFLDFDRDGWLDLVVANYLDYDPHQKCFDAAGVREYCGPHSFPGTVARLFRNTSGRGTNDFLFEDVTVQSGFAKASGPALGVLCADFDGDRWPDVFIADDGKPNRLFINQKNGTFTEEAGLRGIAYTGMGGIAANMGVAIGDVNIDGLFDLFVTHLATEQHTLWAQDPRGLFQDKTAQFGLVNPNWKGTGFGTVLADFDHDGALDLAFVNGAVRRANSPGPRLAKLAPFWSPYAQRNQLFLGGTGRFTDISEENPAFSGRAGVGRGLAMADYDQDGDLDLFVTNAGGPGQFFRNIAAKRGNWLSIRAVDPALGGRDALGAEILLEAGGRRFWRLVQTSFSYLSSSDARAHFGLGEAGEFDRVLVLWPDGTTEVFAGGAANRAIVLERGTGQKHE
jgi:hypothetical protein